ncbi:MAG: cellulase family glycosylhydrolase [Nitrospiraceae bacterium]|nr:cellulase family glycosylhydrolase [Nitrospiraceae bacterium]
MRSLAAPIIFAAVAVLSRPPYAAAAPQENLAMNKPLRLVSVTPDRGAAPVFERVTLAVDLEAAYENPFDSQQVRIDAVVVRVDAAPAETGGSWSVPGFIYAPFRRELVDGHEKITQDGDASWQVRLSFPKPGRYDITVSASDETGAVSAPPVTLTATAADMPGMVRRHPDDHRYFVTDRGETFYAIGANVCWAGHAGTFDYDRWLPAYAEQGANYIRLWLAPGMFTFGLNTRESGFDRIDLHKAWRLDYVMELSERLGIRAMMCIDSFNILRAKKSLYGVWEDAPYPQANGGPLQSPAQYFLDPIMLRAYRERLRYLVARYGYSTSVFAWEFWNEVDLVDEYDSEAIAAWHADMARHLRAIDPWNHLITTSFSNPAGDPAVDCLPELDFVQTHHYIPRDLDIEFYEDRATKRAAADRPHFHGEFGIAHSGDTPKIDPTGIHLQNGLYASVGQLQAGTPMTWWWDSYVEPKGLYPIFGAFARWIDGFDFVAQHARQMQAAIRWTSDTPPSTFNDDLVEPIVASWETSRSNQPMTVKVLPDGEMQHEAPLSRVLHGVRNHPELHNPVTFEVDLPEKNDFSVVVQGVSYAGGAGLTIRLDGKAVLEEDFAIRENPRRKTPVHKYDGAYTIRVPKGRHTIMVESSGNDWFYVAYRIPWRKIPPLRALGVTGDSRALVWVHNRAHTWGNARREDYRPQAIDGAQLNVQGLSPGRWTVETWDTVRGEVTATAEVQIDTEGQAGIELPAVATAVAYRLTLNRR